MAEDPIRTLDINDLSRVSPHLPNEVKLAIADALIAFARMEVSAEQLIWILTGLSPQIGRLMTGMDARPKFALIKTLLTRLMPKQKVLPENFWGTLSDLRDYRNELVHGVWVILDRTIPFSVSYRTKDPNGVTGSAFPIPRLESLTAAANGVGGFFDQLGKDYEAQRKA